MDLPSLIVAMLVTGAAAGILAGLLGVGGGIVIVPALEAALGYLGVDLTVRMHIAVATSLATIIPTSISSAAAHYRKSSIDFQVVRFWWPFILVGAVAGTVIASQVTGRVLAGVFAVVALGAAVNMMRPAQGKVFWGEVPRGPGGALIPTGIGVISTLMGIGGGTMSVPAMTLMSKPVHLAVGTSALLGLVIALPATAGYVVAGWGNDLMPAWSLGYVSVVGFLLITPATVLFAPVGAWIAHALSRRWLSFLFGAFLLVVSIRMALRAFVA
jgi:uncharacterized membrane protein YfcA